jgi:hypothetical protein
LIENYYTGQFKGMKNNMANTKIENKAEEWIRQVALPKLFDQNFSQQSLLLKSGGQYKFDTVSDDTGVVAVISTDPGKTADGKQATDNLQKIRTTVFWAMNIDHLPKLILVLTEQSMIHLIKEEKKKDRFPKEIEVVKIKLPE